VPDQDPSGLGTFEFALRFLGQYADTETNLTYNWRRDYDFVVGRYVESDPIGLRGGVNTYSYAANAPLLLSDPTGLVRWTGTLGGAAYVNRAGGGIFAFDLTSECKCSRRVRIQGIALTAAVGFGVKAASGSSGSAEFFDYNDCPDEGIANGIAAIGSIGVVFIAGISCSNDMQLGSLHSLAGCSGPAYGLDISVGAYLGGSKVVHSSSECCSK